MSETPPQEEILDPIEDPNFRPGISGAGLLFGLVLGLVAGLFYAWQIDPVIATNVSPDQLAQEDQKHYIAAAALEYAASQDLQRAVARLLEVAPNRDPLRFAAETTCALIRSGQVNDLGDIEVIRSLRAIYEPQGVRANCDLTAFNTPVPVTIVPPTPTVTFTPSITPVATKTPTKAVNAGPVNSPIPATSSVREGTVFREAFVESFCDPRQEGMLEIYIRDTNGESLPGVAVRVTDSNRESETFYTGLKPERGDDYADYQMEPEEVYRVSVVESGQPSRELPVTTCDEQGTLISYRVVMQRFFTE